MPDTNIGGLSRRMNEAAASLSSSGKSWAARSSFHTSSRKPGLCRTSSAKSDRSSLIIVHFHEYVAALKLHSELSAMHNAASQPILESVHRLNIVYCHTVGKHVVDLVARDHSCSGNALLQQESFFRRASYTFSEHPRSFGPSRHAITRLLVAIVVRIRFRS